ncbi:Regulatory protein hrpB, putative, partial [Ricinus communis]
TGFKSDFEPRTCPEKGEVPEEILDGVRPPLLRARIEYLRQLISSASPTSHTVTNSHPHLNWAREQGLADYQRTLRIEVTLAMLAAGTADNAQAMLEPLHLLSHNGATGHRELEYLYCAAKAHQTQGRLHESARLYNRYAFVAMQCLREEAQLPTRILKHADKISAQRDDVGTRLPARYRRAYSFIVDNLERPDLSVCEVADEIGVTERALQSTFKRFLGLSPSEVIRRQRMERIRAELMEHPDGSNASLLGVANRWGVQHRSTLTNGWRKQFHEAPTEILKG